MRSAAGGQVSPLTQPHTHTHTRPGIAGPADGHYFW